MEFDIKEFLRKFKENLDKGRAGASGIGVFWAVYNEEGKILLIVRKEIGSIYGKDLTGKWELPGGGVELSDFGDDYQGVIFNSARELKEETGLRLNKLKNIVMLPAWLAKKNIIDLAFVIPVPYESVEKTEEFQKLYDNKEAKFLGLEEIGKMEITSGRMEFMISEAFKYITLI